jgi:peptidoglycan/LPS O-acetylase OafA/YrhL
MIKLASLIRRKNNNFDLIRLIAALMVIFAHSFDLYKTNGYTDPIKKIFNESAGTLAVYIFFFLSGIFITGSFENKKNHLSFILMRAFRIWPALIVCTVLTVFFIGPSLTTFSVKGYLLHVGTWKFFLSNILLYNPASHILPGLFLYNHLAGAVNGSLWTLPVEVKCYFLIFILGIIGAFRYKRSLMIVFLILLVATVSKYNNYIGFFSANVVLFFIAGSVAYLYKGFILLNYKVCFLLISLCLISFNTTFFHPLFYLTLIYGVLIIGGSGIFKSIKLPGDYSYGAYIYGFIVQQVISNLFPSLNSYSSLIIVFPVVAILSVLSWHIIEKQAIEYGKKIRLFGFKNVGISTGSITEAQSQLQSTNAGNSYINKAKHEDINPEV